MKSAVKYTIIATVAAFIGFLFEAPGPIGSQIWPMAEGIPTPEGGTAIALMGMGIIEAIAFGVGVVFLLFGLPWVRERVEKGAIVVWIAVSWMLVNWVPHTAAHMTMGHIDSQEALTSLAAIEYGYHATLVASGIIMVVYFAGGFGRPTTQAADAAAPA